MDLLSYPKCIWQLKIAHESVTPTAVGHLRILTVQMLGERMNWNYNKCLKALS